MLCALIATQIVTVMLKACQGRELGEHLFGIITLFMADGFCTSLASTELKRKSKSISAQCVGES